MPGVDTECEGPGATHHFACKCREQYFESLEALVRELVTKMDNGTLTGTKRSLDKIEEFRVKVFKGTSNQPKL